MKKYIGIVFIAVCLTAPAVNSEAQTKIGYISLQELIFAMPEYKKAETDMQDYQKALGQQSDDYRLEYVRKDSIFKADSLKWTSAMKEIKRKELNELYLKWANFNQQAPQMAQQREQELLAPIQDKAVKTTQAVAKENGYAYILSKEQLVSFPATDDVLPLVAKKLNLKLDEKPPANPTTPAAPKTGGN